MKKILKCKNKYNVTKDDTRISRYIYDAARLLSLLTREKVEGFKAKNKSDTFKHIPQGSPASGVSSQVVNLKEEEKEEQSESQDDDSDVSVISNLNLIFKIGSWFKFNKDIQSRKISAY